MEMSEPFATTVAAVAPVIWAIGTVEVHQVLKRVWALRDERDRHLAEARAAMAAVEDEAALARARGGLRAAADADRRALPPAVLYVAWVSLALAMAACVHRSLAWLAEAGGPGEVSGPAGGTAEFCLWAVMAGLVFVTALPVVTATAEAVRSLRRTRARQRDLAALESAAVARVDDRRRAATAEASAGAVPAPPG
ncbi:hypothetical protein EAO71_36405 [Streptomyces sp. ms191]|uniref:hypothetical protein n=1 Tax=unclassified Streptomyces TaxID=2593676 RepID=UPI0011CE552A|nr:hypothetical protein [Streptomyces sp. ms191]TXS12256.1 hypothetical protein EAO71_36405 [Streptomyces sp. ms191]